MSRPDFGSLWLLWEKRRPAALAPLGEAASRRFTYFTYYTNDTNPTDEFRPPALPILIYFLLPRQGESKDSKDPKEETDGRPF